MAAAAVLVALAVLASDLVLYNRFGFRNAEKYLEQSAPARTCATGALLYHVNHIGQKIVHKLIVHKSYVGKKEELQWQNLLHPHV